VAGLVGLARSKGGCDIRRRYQPIPESQDPGGGSATLKDDRVYLAHIRDAVDRILRYTSEGRSEFDHDEKTQDAVVRNLEIIGEAAKNVSDEMRSNRTDIPWRRLAGMRDKLIHEYFGVNLTIIW
jgi:uncharacterized protein with HEPN domain